MWGHNVRTDDGGWDRCSTSLTVEENENIDKQDSVASDTGSIQLDPVGSLSYGAEIKCCSWILKAILYLKNSND